MSKNYSKLLGKIKECGLTQKKLALLIGKNKSTVNDKLNGKGHFTDDEMTLICKVLGIPIRDIHSYFFCD